MKKMFYFVAVATFALISCQQDEEPVNGVVKNEPITFKASIENLGTRANMNSSNYLEWAQNDKIGIYVNNDNVWKNQSFTLSGNAGSATGVFACDDQDLTILNATAAFFPWNCPEDGTISDYNNVYNGTMYFKLPGFYDNYSSGKMLTPLVASLENGSSEISFKHAGAAVKVTINNLPAGAHSIGMTVDGQQIWGNYQINPADAGTAAMAASGTDNTRNAVWLNYTNNSQSAWTFIFPVPTLTTPKLSFKIYDKNNVLVWSKNLKAQSSDLSRAYTLIMPAIDITPYEKFTTDEHWNIRGTFNSWGQTFMKFDGDDSWVAKNITFQEAGEFKISWNDWGDSYGGSFSKLGEDINGVQNGGNISVPAGTYDIIFKYTGRKIRVVSTGECPYPSM